MLTHPNLLTGACLMLLFCSCVPRSQYATLVTERDDYRAQLLSQDSLAEQQALVLNDSLRRQERTSQQQLQQAEQLRATNVTLSQNVSEANDRYEALLTQNQELLALSAGGNAAVQEALLRQSEDIRQERRALEASRRESSAPVRKATPPTPPVVGTTPKDTAAAATMVMDRLGEELRQLLRVVNDTAYTLARAQPQSLQLSLSSELLLDPSGGVSINGQTLLRKLAATMRNYGRCTYTIVGHANSSAVTTPLAAYEASTRQAIAVCTLFARFGLDPARLVAAGKGQYSTEQDGRTDIFIDYLD